MCGSYEDLSALHRKSQESLSHIEDLLTLKFAQVKECIVKCLQKPSLSEEQLSSCLEDALSRQAQDISAMIGDNVEVIKQTLFESLHEEWLPQVHADLYAITNSPIPQHFSYYT
jgi:hypothetical protein